MPFCKHEKRGLLLQYQYTAKQTGTQVKKYASVKLSLRKQTEQQLLFQSFGPKVWIIMTFAGKTNNSPCNYSITNKFSMKFIQVIPHEKILLVKSELINRILFILLKHVLPAIPDSTQVNG